MRGLSLLLVVAGGRLGVWVVLLMVAGGRLGVCVVLLMVAGGKLGVCVVLAGNSDHTSNTPSQFSKMLQSISAR